MTIDVPARALTDIGVPAGRITVSGVALSISAALQHLDSWLDCSGATAINNVMEDAATAEIAGSQRWQWRVSGARHNDGPLLDTIDACARLELDRREGRHAG